MRINLCVNCMSDMGEASICPKCGYDEHTSTQSGSFIKRRTILNGRYIVGNAMGQGGFGITYIGFDMLLNTKVAIKEYFPMGNVIRDNMSGNTVQWTSSQFSDYDWKAGCEKFIAEAQKMAKLNAVAGIVSVHDTFYENGTSYIVMDYVDGITLKNYIKKEGLISHERIVDLFAPLLKSLAKAHKNGLIHRDISPDNIMINEDGELMLLDLGAAKDLNYNSNEFSMPVMKMGFSPAEQYVTKGDIGPWTDVYAMCATIYYCIYGKVPPDSMERLMADELNFPQTSYGKLPDDFVATLAAGLANRKEERIQTMNELLDGLEGKIKFDNRTSENNNIQPVNTNVQPTAASGYNMQQANMNIQPTAASGYNMQQANMNIQPTMPAPNYNAGAVNMNIQPTMPAPGYNAGAVNMNMQPTAPAPNYNSRPVNPNVRSNPQVRGYNVRPQNNAVPRANGNKKTVAIFGSLALIAVVFIVVLLVVKPFSNSDNDSSGRTTQSAYKTTEESVAGVYKLSSFGGYSISELKNQADKTGTNIDELDTFIIQLFSDGSFSLQYSSEYQTGTYEISGQNIYLTVDGEMEGGTIKNGSITIGSGDEMMVFTK